MSIQNIDTLGGSSPPYIPNNKRKFSRENPLNEKSLSELPLNLEELEAPGLAWQLKNVSELTHRCKKLKTLDVCGTEFALPAQGLIEILKANRGIEKLKASDSHLDPSCLDSLSESVQCLDIHSCDDLSPNDVIKFLSRTSKMKELSLVRELATKEVADAISKYCPDLEVLEFSEARNISEATYINIAKNCPKLKEISFYYSENFSDYVFQEFLEKCENLTKANVRNTTVSDVSLDKIYSLNRGMINLDLSHCHMTIAGLESLLKVSKDSLEALNLGEIKIDKELIKMLVKYHPPLKSFNFWGITWDYGFEPKVAVLLEVITHFPHLKEIYINDFRYVDNSDLLKIKKICPDIKNIYTSSEQISTFAKGARLDEASFCKKFFEEHGIIISEWGGG